MQNPAEQIRQGSTVFEKPGILSEKFDELQLLNNFCWNFAHVSYLPMCSKGCSKFVSFCLDLELFAKIKGPGFYTLTDTRFFNNSESKQNKKILNTLL